MSEKISSAFQVEAHPSTGMGGSCRSDLTSPRFSQPREVKKGSGGSDSEQWMEWNPPLSGNQFAIMQNAQSVTLNLRRHPITSTTSESTLLLSIPLHFKQHIRASFSQIYSMIKAFYHIKIIYFLVSFPIYTFKFITLLFMINIPALYLCS